MLKFIICVLIVSHKLFASFYVVDGFGEGGLCAVLRGIARITSDAYLALDVDESSLVTTTDRSMKPMDADLSLVLSERFPARVSYLTSREFRKRDKAYTALKTLGLNPATLGSDEISEGITHCSITCVGNDADKGEYVVEHLATVFGAKNEPLKQALLTAKTDSSQLTAEQKAILADFSVVLLEDNEVHLNSMHRALIAIGVVNTIRVLVLQSAINKALSRTPYVLWAEYVDSFYPAITMNVETFADSEAGIALASTCNLRGLDFCRQLELAFRERRELVKAELSEELSAKCASLTDEQRFHYVELAVVEMQDPEHAKVVSPTFFIRYMEMQALVMKTPLQQFMEDIRAQQLFAELCGMYGLSNPESEFYQDYRKALQKACDSAFAVWLSKAESKNVYWIDDATRDIESAMQTFMRSLDLKRDVAVSGHINFAAGQKFVKELAALDSEHFSILSVVAGVTYELNKNPEASAETVFASLRDVYCLDATE